MSVVGQNPGLKTPNNYGGANITFGVASSTVIGSTTTAAIPANLNRKYLAVCNDSNEVMYLSFGSSAIMNKGIRLNANGGVLEWIGPGLFTAALNAICASGTKTLTYQEGS